MNQLTSGSQINRAITVTAGAAGTSDVSGSAIDTAGFEGVMHVLQLGAIVSGAVTSAKLQHSATTTDGDFTDVTGTSVTIADTDDEKVVYLDYRRPTKRYVRVLVDRGTQNATVSAVAVCYGARSQPLDQGSNVNGVAVSG